MAELQSQTGLTISLQSQQFAGTPRYAAPEQVAGKRTKATDWYALGVMLYEAMTGEVPFTGSAVQIILKKQTEDAPTLSGRANLPQDLAELCDQLLEREPQRRPKAETIAEALGVVATLARAWDAPGSCGLATAATATSHDSSSSETFLIGRESQLAELEGACQELLKEREPVVAFISGRSGEGKTSLAEKFLSPLRSGNEMLVLSGRCYDRESVPFKAIDTLIDALMAFLRSRTNAEVLQLLPDDIQMLAQLFPVLRRVEAVASQVTTNISGIDSRQVRYRAFAALRELLATISKTTPVVLFVDDLQWGDADSAAALWEMMLPPNPPTVMLLGSYRSDEADESPFLNEWQSQQSRSQAPAWERGTSNNTPSRLLL